MNHEIVDGYLTLEENNWQRNDRITITFDMPVRKVVSNKLVKANEGKMALERGPLVFCAEEVDNPQRNTEFSGAC